MRLCAATIRSAIHQHYSNGELLFMRYEQKIRSEKVMAQLWEEYPLKPQAFPILLSDTDDRRWLLKADGREVGYVKRSTATDCIQVRWKSMEENEATERALTIDFRTANRKNVAYVKYRIDMGYEFCSRLRQELQFASAVAPPRRPNL